MKTKRKFYARKCDITGLGMNEGFVMEDSFDAYYIKMKKDLIKSLRTYEEYNEIEDDEQMLEKAHADEMYYWTQWNILDDCDEFCYDLQGNEYNLNDWDL